MNSEYILVTGYYSPPNDKFAEDFFELWYENSVDYCDIQPSKIYILNADSKKPNNWDRPLLEWIDTHNFGHAIDIKFEKDPIKFCGWSVAYMTGLMLAYAQNKDFIFKEQDVLCFGPWVKSLYDHLNISNTKMLLRMDPLLPYGLEQSLVICKHEFIPEFLWRWLQIPINDVGKLVDRMRPEQKFLKICEELNSEIDNIPFGYGGHSVAARMFPNEPKWDKINYDINSPWWIHRQFQYMTNDFFNALRDLKLTSSKISISGDEDKFRKDRISEKRKLRTEVTYGPKHLHPENL